MPPGTSGAPVCVCGCTCLRFVYRVCAETQEVEGAEANASSEMLHFIFHAPGHRRGACVYNILQYVCIRYVYV